jgi:outer membrane protein assembly factor BamB
MQVLRSFLYAAIAAVQVTTGLRAEQQDLTAWTTFGNGPSHAGYYPAAIGSGRVSEGWSKAFPPDSRGFPPIFNQVAVVGPRVYLTTNHYYADGMFAAAVDTKTGDELWHYPLEPSFGISGPTVSDGHVIFLQSSGSNGSGIYILDGASGQLVRRIPFQTQSRTIFGPTVLGDIVWIPGGYFGGLESFKLSDGTQRFLVSLAPADDWTPTYYQNELYACIDGVFTALDPQPGARRWTLDLKRPGEILLFAAQPVVANNRAFAISFGRIDFDVGNSVLLTAIDLTSHAVLWRQPNAYYYPGGAPAPKGFSGIPASDGASVYAISGSAVYAFDAATGEPQGSYKAGYPLQGQPLITKDLVITYSTTGGLPEAPIRNGFVYIFDKITHNLKSRLLAGGPVSLADGVLYVVHGALDFSHEAILQTYTFLDSGPPAPLRNISTRLQVETGDKVAIAGFIITGTDQKTVMLRGIGPTLQAAGLKAVLADPSLELHNSSGEIIATNDNWGTTQVGGIISDFQDGIIRGSSIAPKDSREAAIVATLEPGPYTVILGGVNNSTGVGLIEAYDLDPSSGSKMANISTRGFIASGEIMIAGFIIGSKETRILARAMSVAVSFPGISDPTLELHDSNGAVVAFNDNWKDSQQFEIEATGIAPNTELESAVLQTLSSGAYTAILRGVNATVSGGALVEIYNLQ